MNLGAFPSTFGRIASEMLDGKKKHKIVKAQKSQISSDVANFDLA